MDKADKVQELEQEYRILVENMGEGLWAIDENMVTTFVNNKLCEIIGYSKDEILGKKVSCFFEGESKKRLRTELEKRPKGISSTYTLPARTKKREEIFLSVSGVPLLDKKGKFKGAFAIISDITERKKLQDKLEERTMELEKEINKRTNLLGDLYRGVADTAERNRLAREIHDFCTQTLVSSILKIELCEKLLEKDPKNLKRELKELKKLLGKSIKLTRNVMLRLRLPDFHRTGFATVLKQYLEEFHKKTGIAATLNLKLGESLPIKIQVGTYRIIREAMNNIRKHAMAKNVDLRLTTDKNRNLHLIIKDDGKGFDLKRALTQSKYARNFGLMGMEEQAKFLGGTFTVETEKGQGAKIKVKIPLKE